MVPTKGRIVYVDVSGLIKATGEPKPFSWTPVVVPAIIRNVHNATCIDVCAFTDDGPENFDKICQGDVEKSTGLIVWDWMPFQKEHPERSNPI